MVAISKWAITGGGNALGATPDYPPEGMDKSDVNNVMRENMAGVRRWYQDPTYINIFEALDEAWGIAKISDTIVRVTGPVNPSTILNTGRRIRIEPGPVLGYVVSVAQSAPNYDITVTIDGAGIVPASPTKVELGCVGGGNGMFLNVGTSGNTLMVAEDLQTTMTAVLAADSAANKTFGTGASELPQNSDLGSGSLATIGTGPTEVPINSDFPTFGDLAELNRGRMKLVELSSDFVYSGGDFTERYEAITPLANISFPGTPNGTLNYLVHVVLFLGGYGGIAGGLGGRFNQMEVVMGTVGDETDDTLQVMHIFDHLPSTNDYGGTAPPGGQSKKCDETFIVRPSGSSEKLSVTWKPGNNFLDDNDTVFAAGTNQRSSFVLIQLLDDLWE